MSTSRAAAVVGSGPNGLAEAVTLARAGVQVTVYEAAPTIGGGTRTSEVVRPGILHDVCSAIHPMAFASEFFRAFELTKRVEFATPGASYATPLDGRPAAIAYRDLERTARELGADGGTYSRFYRPLLDRLDGVLDLSHGGSMLRPPADVRAAAWTVLRTLEQGTPLWNLRFTGDAAPALITGVAAHSIARLPGLAPSAVGVVLGALGHATGWPVPIGGSRTITDALAADLLAHGGRIETSHRIRDVRELNPSDVLFFDTSAGDLARIARDRLPSAYRRSLRRFRYGNAATTVDFVLDGPIPWADPRIAAAATVHVGGTRREVAAAERTVAQGNHPERPFVLLAQPTRFDPTRNPQHVNAVWSYTHVPHGSTRDVSADVIAQIERYAPGFRDRIQDLRVITAGQLGAYNPNYHGGDISAGAVTLRQLLARPTLSRTPWQTPARGIYLCSASASPGPGVHGLSGYYAARAALATEYGLPVPSLALSG